MPDTQLTLGPEDRQRLAKQAGAVWTLMQDNQWRTLSEIRQALVMRLGVVASEASISARLRELRGLHHQVDRKKVARGLFAYRVHERFDR